MAPYENGGRRGMKIATIGTGGNGKVHSPVCINGYGLISPKAGPAQVREV